MKDTFIFISVLSSRIFCFGPSFKAHNWIFVFCPQEVKVNSPDYKEMNTEAALQDFLQRIEHYQEKYEALDEALESDLSFMKIYNTGEKVVVHKHEGHIQARIVYYLMNIHIVPRTIYLSRVSFKLFLTFLCLIYLKFYLELSW